MARRRVRSSRPRRCDGKARHTSRDNAETAIAKSVHQGVAAWRLHAYPCTTGGKPHWHVGHTPRGKR